MILFLFLTVSVSTGELALAKKCVEKACVLPECRCASTQIPNNLKPRDTPQFVIVSFSDPITTLNIRTYREILYGRRNTNGCLAGATFFVSHENNNYQLVNEVFNRGFEIALHSISRSKPTSYWAEAKFESFFKEFADQIVLMSTFANIPRSSIKGARIPFLQMGGNESFELNLELGLYDYSWETYRFTNPGLLCKGGFELGIGLGNVHINTTVNWCHQLETCNVSVRQFDIYNLNK